VTPLLVIARDELIGDALMALPAICGLAERCDKLYLAQTNRAVAALADYPANVIDVLRSEPHWRSQSMPTTVLGFAAACNYNPMRSPMHPIHMLMAWAGLEVYPDVLPQPKIRVPEVAARDEVSVSYDVVLAPWTDARERTMTPLQVRQLIVALSPGNFAVLGGATDDRLALGTNAELGYGWPLDYVARVMRRAKCVVTIDSGPGRLAHAAGIGDRHIILDSTVTPQRSQGHPGATFVRGGIKDGQALWNIEEIVAAIKEKLA
jgi:hypothetical protein